MKKNILIIAAHPDDEVLGCGATIARLAKEDQNIYISILGEGITSRYTKREQADKSLIERLHSCSQKVAKILGAKDLFLHNLPDNRFDTIPLLDVVKIIEDLIERIQPQTIYTHHSSDLNIDHSITNRAVLTATRPLKGSPVKEIFAFEVPSSTEWSFNQLGINFYPKVFVDVKDTLNLKIEAMKIYESEVKNFPHPRSPEALMALAQQRGSIVGLEAVEAFDLIRKIF